MSECVKEFTFDLDTKELKNIFGEKSYTKAYNEIFDFFCKEHGFEHRQGSVYCSGRRMSDAEVVDMAHELKHKIPWLKTCLKRMDVADIGNIHELTEVITSDSVIKTKEYLCQELNDNDFEVSDALMKNYQKLTDSRGDIISLEEISAEYRSGSADENINAIGNELKAQELQLIDELAAPEI